MRSLITLACTTVVLSAIVTTAGAAEPDVGTLSVERGRGVVMLEVRGLVLGRLANGSITVTDRSPNDPYVANVTGRRIVVQRRLGPAKVFIRGQGLRFRMLGGSYRIVIRGAGIALSAVGRGAAQLDGEPRFPGDDVGIYSVEDDADCGSEPETCQPIPEEPIRIKLEPAPTPEGAIRRGDAAR
jgi:hypothetical protein